MTSPLAEPECRQLTEALRELKDRTRLSLAGLAEQTPYSKSAWGRYLGGQVLPPREAVEVLCQVAHEPAGRLVALWELADLAVGQRGAVALSEPGPDMEPEPEPETPPVAAAVVRLRSRVAYAVVIALVLVSVTSVALLSSRRSGAAAAPRASPTAPRCHGKSCAGQSPDNMMCGTRPRDLSSRQATTGEQVEIRYSVECGAAWARIWRSRIGDRIEVSAPGGPARTATVTDTYDAEGYLFTPMVAVTAGVRVRACLHPVAGGPRECFEGTVGP
ncbi:XRE family transcriptional regulator [Streptomyces sp. NPDC005251]|uniref:XRE family transcriptional regulator n=1 Tax=unclassified Streptomyces TaxID=2593676 RepID=UPI0033B1136F